MLIRRWVVAILLIAGSTRVQASEKAILLFVDQTMNLSGETKTRYQSYLRMLADHKGFHKITIRLLPIHARTMSAAALADCEFSGRSGSRYAKKRAQEQDRLLIAIRKAYDVPKSQRAIQRRTDLFGAVYRAAKFVALHPDAIKKVYFFSDMIEYSQMQLLRDKLFVSNRLTELARQVMETYGWDKKSLRGVKIKVLKPATVFGGTRLPNQIMLRIDRFWEMLFTGLGAERVEIDTI